MINLSVLQSKLDAALRQANIGPDEITARVRINETSHEPEVDLTFHKQNKSLSGHLNSAMHHLDGATSAEVFLRRCLEGKLAFIVAEPMPSDT